MTRSRPRRRRSTRSGSSSRSRSSGPVRTAGTSSPTWYPDGDLRAVRGERVHRARRCLPWRPVALPVRGAPSVAGRRRGHARDPDRRGVPARTVARRSRSSTACARRSGPTCSSPFVARACSPRIGVARLGRATTAEAAGTGRLATPFARAGDRVALAAGRVAGHAWHRRRPAIGLGGRLHGRLDATSGRGSQRRARERASTTLSLPLPIICRTRGGEPSSSILIGTAAVARPADRRPPWSSPRSLPLAAPVAAAPTGCARREATWPRDGELTVALRGERPNRVLTLGAARLLRRHAGPARRVGRGRSRMFCSLNLRASDDLLEAAPRATDADASAHPTPHRRRHARDVRRAVPGHGLDRRSRPDKAVVCRVPARTEPLLDPGRGGAPRRPCPGRRRLPIAPTGRGRWTWPRRTRRPCRRRSSGPTSGELVVPRSRHRPTATSGSTRAWWPELVGRGRRRRASRRCGRWRHSSCRWRPAGMTVDAALVPWDVDRRPGVRGGRDHPRAGLGDVSPWARRRS